MAVIKTTRNFVYAYEPQAGDTHVQTLILSPTERYALTTQGIEQYDAVVAWAVGIADQMAHGVTVMPITATEFIKVNRERLEKRACQHDRPRARRNAAGCGQQDAFGDARQQQPRVAGAGLRCFGNVQGELK